MRSRWLTALLAFAIPMMAGACVDPKGDFESFNERTAGFRATPPPKDGGGVDSAPPAVAVEGLYFGACLSKLAAGRIDRVLRFYTETKYTPDATGGTGKITLKLTPMKLGPGNTAPPTVSKDQTVGMTYTVTDSPTNAQGVYAASLGTVNVPGASNPISGRDIIVEMAAVPGRFAKEKFCSQLSGHVTQPTDIQLEGESNTCIYLPVKEGDKPPEFKLDGSDFPDTCTL
jgi:hypothetical protein